VTSGRKPTFPAFGVSLLALVLLVAASARRVVPMTIHRQSAPEGLPVRRRETQRATFHEDLGNNMTVGAYFTEVEVGSPGQKVTLHIDTGRTDVWLLSKSADLCTSTVLQALHGKCKDTL